MIEISPPAAVLSAAASPRSAPPGKQTFEIDPLHDPRWGTFIQHRGDASIFHRPGWLRALKTCYGYEPLVLSATPPGSPITNGLLCCAVQSPFTGKRIVSVPFSDHCEPLVNSPEEFHSLLQNLTERIDQERWNYFEIRPITCDPVSSQGFGKSNSYYLHRLSLLRSEESLFRSFHKDCVQRKIRRAEKESLRYEEGSSETLLKQFYQLLIMTRRRQGIPPQPLKWFRSLSSSFGPDLKIRVASKGDTPIASILTISDRKTMVYKYGCSDLRFNNLGGTFLLFWRSILQAKEAGMEEFDLGRSEPTNLGLIAFKEHWGAERIPLNYWRYPAAAAGVMPEYAIKHFRRIIAILPDAPLSMLGRLLYPHVG